MELPNDIIIDIINKAGVSIDSRLELKRNFGDAICWRPVEVDVTLREKLDAVCARRTRHYEKYKVMKTQNSFRWSTTLDLTPPLKVCDDAYIEISVTDFGDAIEMCMKKTCIVDVPVFSVCMSAINCDVHTGQAVENDFE